MGLCERDCSENRSNCGQFLHDFEALRYIRSDYFFFLTKRETTVVAGKQSLTNLRLCIVSFAK